MSYRFRDRGNTGVTIKGVLITLAVFFCSFHSSVSAHQRGPDEEYRVWIENEVDPIISEEERGFFSSLDNNGEKEKFVKAFWKSLDPTPGTGTKRV